MQANIHGLGPAKKAEDKKGVEHFASSGHTRCYLLFPSALKNKPALNWTCSSTAVARPVRGAPGAGAGAGAGAGPPLDDIASILGAARQYAHISVRACSDFHEICRHKDDTTGQDRNIGLITLYANGFIVGDGEFRDIKDPRNANFLKSLKAGYNLLQCLVVCCRLTCCRVTATCPASWKRSVDGNGGQILTRCK